MSDHTLLVATVFAIVLAAFASGCGNEALRINTSIARAMLEVQAESGPLIRELRVAAGVSAGHSAHARGEPEAVAQIAARAAASRWQCAIDGHRLYSIAVGTYIDTLALWGAGEDFELTDAIPFVIRALDTYRVLASCLLSLGSEVLPAVPAFLDVIPPMWMGAPDGE